GNAIGAAVDALRAGAPWERARAADTIACSGAAGDAVAQLTAALTDESEAVRLNVAYALAGAGDAGLSVLAHDLRREAQASEPLATAKTADNAHGTNPTAPLASHALATNAGGTAVAADLLDDDHWLVRAVAADALGNMGTVAGDLADRLIHSTSDEHWWVRRNAIEALGRVADLSEAALERVTACIDDEDYRVRRNAAIALHGVQRVTDATVPALGRMLHDDNRYNRFYAAEALRNVIHVAPEAGPVLLDYLFTSRWCPLTDSADRY
ncbi:MAG: HEAT repeat domain-containing protein, partial [bacterium]|nr:HEAT repeat domain-containing protein [bacterium]